MSQRVPENQSWQVEQDRPTLNKAAIDRVRRHGEYISDQNRRNVFQWCVRAERQIENHVLPWGELYEVLISNNDDISYMSQLQPEFAEFVAEFESGDLQRISTPSPTTSIPVIAEEQQETATAIRRLYTSKFPKKNEAAG